MTNINFKPSFKYCFLNMISGVSVFLLIMLIITAAVAITANISIRLNGEIAIMFNAFETAAAIAAFVIGIVSIREDMRLLMQNGVGRRTAFLSEIAVAVVTMAIMSLAGILIARIGGVLAADNDNVMIDTLYSFLFTQRVHALAPAVIFGETFLWNLMIYLSAYFTGMFISLLFYRLSKIWKIVAAIGLPALFLIILPTVLVKSLPGLVIYIYSIDSFYDPWTGIMIGSGNTLVFCIASWLMIRRAPIKPGIK